MDREDREQQKFMDFIARKVGTRHWCVAPKLTLHMRSMGHELAISEQRYAQLCHEYQEKVDA